MHQRQVEHLIVVVQACLAMQLVTTAQHTTSRICIAVAYASQTGMCCRHGAHCTWLLHHIAIKACAQVGPAQQHTLIVLYLGPAQQHRLVVLYLTAISKQTFHSSGLQQHLHSGNLQRCTQEQNVSTLHDSRCDTCAQ